MAIFSSSKRKKESLGTSNGQTTTNNSQNGPNSSPPLHQGSFANRQSQAQVQGQSSSGSLGRSYNDTTRIPSLGGSSSQQLSNSEPSSAAPPAHTVLYPWAQRRLNLLNSSLLHPVDPANPLAPLPTNPIWGPPSTLPFPRYGHSVNPVASVPGGDLYIFGGLVQNAVKNDLYILSCAPNTNTGPAGPPPGTLSVGLVETRGQVPGPRVGHASVGVGNVLIVWGGDTKSRPEERQDDGLYLLNLTTRDWTRVTTSGPTPEGRYGHAAAMVGSKFFVFGGQKDDGGFMNDLAWFDLQKLKAGSPRWAFVDYSPQAVVPPKRTGHSTVTHGDCIYVFGGTDGQYHYNDTWCYDTNSGLWSELSCIGYIPVPREGHAATLVDDVMYVFGGRGVDGKDLDDLAAFKITTQRWFMFQNMGPAPSGRSGHAMATWQNKVFVLGGESYTSQRADDPSFVHVLDTSKIKYPQDSNRPPASVTRKSSIPVMASNGAPQLGAIPPSVKVHPPLAASAPVNLPPLEEEPVKRTNSSNGTSRNVNGGQSFGLVNEPGPSSPASKIGKRAAGGATSPPPIRPARPDESEDTFRRAPEQINSLDRVILPPDDQRRSIVDNVQQRDPSPTLSNVTPPQTFTSTFSNSSAPKITTFPSRTVSAVPNAEPITIIRASDATNINQSIPSTNGNGIRNGANGQGSSMMATEPSTEVLREKDAEIQRMKGRENWMKASLAMAVAKGFVAPTINDEEAPLAFKKEGEGDNRQIVEALVEMKQELARAKSAMASQAESVNEQVASATQARLAALQEAAYYRSKLAALESGSASEVGKLERERAQDLEHKLAASLLAKTALEEEVAALEAAVDHHSQMKLAAEERGSSATSRADAVESSYSRSLADYAELQRQAQLHQSTMQDHVLQITSLTASTQRATAENSHFKERSETAEAALAQHIATVEATQVALAAATARNEEIHSVWSNSQAELAEHQTRVQQLQTELDTNKIANTSAIARAADLERILNATREEHEATKVLATGSLAELVASHREAKSRDVGTELDLERSKASEIEAESFKRLHQEGLSKLDETLVELNESRAREVGLQTQMLSLRSEIATLRDNHATALADIGRHKSFAANKEVNLRDSTRTREAAEIKSTLLQNLMQEHGLAINEEDLLSRSTPLDASATPEQLHRRIVELEGRLDSRTRAHAELETAHDDARREVQDSEQRFRDVSRQHQVSADQVDHLTGELERVQTSRSVGPEESERAEVAEKELGELQGRHRHLESTHLKAVQYVKGTEKMLRRMKEELTRYKSRNEELEAEIADNVIPADLKEELEDLHIQVADLRGFADKSSSENEGLQLQLAKLQADHEMDLHQSNTGSSLKISQLEAEISRLDIDLDKAQHEIEETLTVNDSLNRELETAMKTGGGAKGVDAGASAQLEQDLAQARSKADWLKRENLALESRLASAEEKVKILLDHMEGGSAGDGSGDESPEANRYEHNAQSTLSHNWTRTAANGKGGDSDDGDDHSAYSADHSRTSSTQIPPVSQLHLR